MLDDDADHDHEGYEAENADGVCRRIKRPFQETGYVLADKQLIALQPQQPADKSHHAGAADQDDQPLDPGRHGL